MKVVRGIWRVIRGSFILIVFIFLFLIKRNLNFILFHSDISLNSSKTMKQKIKT